jgi:eukaryotic-like serine/threonine-protein kinase
MIGRTLAHYEITSQLGKGGMGEVYQAKDLKLGRDVAIKVLPEEFAKDADRVARFQREAKLLASLNHPSIAAIYGLEESGGTNFLVLELVEGETLADRLTHGSVPVEDSVKLALQIATGLEAAHKKSIIHRDLKPANIMVADEGSVKLLDFGLARLYELNAAGSDVQTADFPATQAGAVLGTVAYMAPEQAQGRPADARSDIFSFGLVLYEMLSGKRAFSGESPLVIAAALMKEEPPPIQVSPALDGILRRCLAKQPSGRYQTMSEVKTALEQALKEIEAESSKKPQPSIAVLPFVNMSGDKEQEYFSDGLTEEIINALTQIPELKVIARTSSFAFRNKEQDIRRIAEALSVTSILEGSVRKAGSRIRITAQLISAADGSHLWSERYDRELNDIFAIQDEISGAIAEKLRLQLSKRHRVESYTENLEAYNLYLKGRHYFKKMTAEGFPKSKEYFEQAIALDQNYALAWCGLADYYQILGTNGFMPPAVANTECRKAVQRALELDEMLPEAHAVSAVLCILEYDWNGSERELRRALDLNPKSDVVLTIYSIYYLLPLQRFDEAIAVSKRALDLDPLSPLMYCNLGLIYLFSRQWDRALEQYKHALEIDPHFGTAYNYLAFAHLWMGDFDEAMLAAEAAIREIGRVPNLLGLLGAIHARAGRIDEAKKLLEEMQSAAQKMYVPPTSFASIYFALGADDSGLTWLEKAVEEPSLITIIMVGLEYIYYDSLRSHPRYQALRRKMNLEP